MTEEQMHLMSRASRRDRKRDVTMTRSRLVTGSEVEVEKRRVNPLPLSGFPFCSASREEVS